MEKEDRIALLPFDGGWSDVGSWDSLLGLIASTAPDRETNSILVNTQNVFVHGSGRTIAGVGLKDLIIVDDDDATLIVAQRPYRTGQTGHRGTGSCRQQCRHRTQLRISAMGDVREPLDSAVCKVKRLTVDPGQHLSLQYHHKRSEHWVVVAGTATVLLDGKTLTLEAGHSIDIPLGAHHALGNDTKAPVIVIEVQMGSYFGEDDIVRVSDPTAGSKLSISANSS